MLKSLQQLISSNLSDKFTKFAQELDGDLDAACIIADAEVRIYFDNSSSPLFEVLTDKRKINAIRNESIMDLAKIVVRIQDRLCQYYPKTFAIVA